MANFNKVILIGNLTRDPECRTFSNGGKVAKFGFAVNNRKKNTQTGQWEDEPMFIDCEAFNRGEFGKLADTIETYCKKGSQICIEGRLQLDQWDDKTTGQKRSKHKVVVETMQLLGSRQDGQGGGGPARPAGAPARAASPAPASRGGDDYGDEPAPNNGEEIPF
jgi:single-strand DNA-binding protein